MHASAFRHIICLSSPGSHGERTFSMMDRSCLRCMPSISEVKTKCNACNIIVYRSPGLGFHLNNWPKVMAPWQWITSELPVSFSFVGHWTNTKRSMKTKGNRMLIPYSKPCCQEVHKKHNAQRCFVLYRKDVSDSTSQNRIFRLLASTNLTSIIQLILTTVRPVGSWGIICFGRWAYPYGFILFETYEIQKTSLRVRKT